MGNLMLAFGFRHRLRVTGVFLSTFAKHNLFYGFLMSRWARLYTRIALNLRNARDTIYDACLAVVKRIKFNSFGLLVHSSSGFKLFIINNYRIISIYFNFFLEYKNELLL